MGLICCFKDCKEKQNSDEKISFHQFPNDPELRKQWIQAVQRENFKPSSQTKVCSKHFANDCFIQSGWSSRRTLKPDAVPDTILDEPDIHYIEGLHPVNVVWIKSNDTRARMVYIELMVTKKMYHQKHL
ncbi:THAP domain-containing protein 2-like isoform X2 [Megalopta genalis]|uniref:THAP domain-containing protein 2-like isoform X2 n=1 Tax=Megalopta genalis TaxID=115081 RepID=UPI003FD5443F